MIEELLAGEDHKATIDELKEGRNSPQPKVEEYKVQLDPKGHDINDLVKRPDKKVKVDKPSSADQNLLQVTNSNNDEENFKLEPVARVALAIQKLIVKRAVAFTFGNPVVHNAEPEEDTKEKDVLKSVNRVLFDTKTRTLNRRIARNIFSCTEAAEVWYPTANEHSNYGFDSKFKLRVAVYSPLRGDKLFPYFDNTGDLIAFSREFEVSKKGKGSTYFETFTKDQHLMWVNSNTGWEVVEGYPKVNIIGKIPVVYGQQPQVEWEDVQGLIDRLEKLLSNFADTNDYHASPKIVVKGDIVGFASKGESGGILELEGDDADAKYLSWQHAPESVKLEIETLLNMIYTITQTPDISFATLQNSIGSISGVALKLLFMDAHLKVQDKMEIFDDYLQRRLTIIQSFLGVMNTKDTEYLKACSSLTIEPEIVPFMIDDEAALVDLLIAANGQKPIISQKTAIQTLGWAKDVDTEYEQIQEEEAMASYSSTFEPTV